MATVLSDVFTDESGARVSAFASNEAYVHVVAFGIQTIVDEIGNRIGDAIPQAGKGVTRLSLVRWQSLVAIHSKCQIRHWVVIKAGVHYWLGTV